MLINNLYLLSFPLIHSLSESNFVTIQSDARKAIVFGLGDGNSDAGAMTAAVGKLLKCLVIALVVQRYAANCILFQSDRAIT